MTASVRGQHGFELAGENIGGVFRPIARFQCTRCDSVFNLPYKAGIRLNPEAIANSVRNHGWQVEARRANQTLCPDCRGKRSKGHDPDSELKKFQEKHAMAVKPVLVTPPPDAPPPTQRQQIRFLLDQHFDEAQGCYLEDYSDERIATAVGAPIAHVEQLRNTAYGPIKISATEMQLKRDVAAMRQKLANQLGSVDSLVETMKAELAQLHKELAAIEARLVSSKS